MRSCSRQLSLRRGFYTLSLSVAFLSACGGGGGGGDGGGSGGEPPVLKIDMPATNTEGVAQAWTSTAAGLAGTKFAWNFGDGTSSTEGSPSHRYAAAGAYTVTLSVIYANGLSRQASVLTQVGRVDPVHGLACSGTEQHGWCWAGGVRLVRQSHDSQGMALRATELGEISVSVDGGKTWQSKLKTSSDDPIIAIHTAGAVAKALTQRGKVLSSGDSGSSWTTAASGLNIELPDAFSTLPTPRLSGALGGTRLLLEQGEQSPRLDVSADGGLSWRRLASVELGGVIYNIRPRSGAFLDAVGRLWALAYRPARDPSSPLGEGQYAVLMSADAGGSFSVQLELPPLQELVPKLNVSGERLLVLGSYRESTGYSLRQWSSENGGKDWREEPVRGISLDGEPLSLQLLADDIGLSWAFVGGAGAYKRMPGGNSWELVGRFSPDNTCVPKMLGSKAPALVCDGAAFLSIDGGVQWRTLAYGSLLGTGLLPDPDRRAWWKSRDLWKLADGSFVLQHNGSLLTSSDAERWTLLNPWPSLQQVWMLDRLNGWAFDSEGNLLRSSDSGRTWRLSQSRLVDISGAPSISFADAMHGWLLGEFRVLLRTDNGGETWEKPTGPTFNLGYYQFLDAQRGVTTDVPGNQLFSTNDGGKTWTPSGAIPRPHQASVSGIAFRTPSLGLVLLSDGGMLRTVDGGKTWTPVAGLGTNPLRQGKFLDDKHVVAIATGGWLYRSADAGQTWSAQQVSGLPDVQALSSLPDGSRTWLLGAGGELAVSEDFGTTWRAQSTGGGGTAALRQLYVLDSRTQWLLDGLGRLRITDSAGD